MLPGIKAESALRITEIRESVDFLSSILPAPPTATPRHINTSKGLVYVQLYGVIENTILSTVSIVLDTINSQSLKVSDLKPYLWGMALHPELDSLISVTSKKWDKRHGLFHHIVLDPSVNIDTSIMPTDGRNFGYRQLESIWRAFYINEPIFNDINFRGRLEDIVTNRNNIAHGNSTASVVGSTVSIQDLYDRVADVSGFCSYFISVMEDYIANGKYKI